MSGYRVVAHADGASFLDAVNPFLMQADEANALITGIAGSMTAPTTGSPTMFSVTHDDEVALAALHLSMGVSLSVGAPAAAVELARYLADACAELPNVGGPAPVADAFAQAWARTRNVRIAPDLAMTLMATRQIEPWPEVEGTLQPVTEAHAELVGDWADAFIVEIFGAQSNQRAWARSSIPRRIADASVHFWMHDGEPVSMVGWQPAATRGARINMVYTPPAHRSRGYAKAAVGTLARRLTGEGRWCALFVDDANPIVNHMYPALGFRPVERFLNLDFVAP